MIGSEFQFQLNWETNKHQTYNAPPPRLVFQLHVAGSALARGAPARACPEPPPGGPSPSLEWGGAPARPRAENYPRGGGAGRGVLSSVCPRGTENLPAKSSPSRSASAPREGATLASPDGTAVPDTPHGVNWPPSEHNESACGKWLTLAHSQPSSKRGRDVVRRKGKAWALRRRGQGPRAPPLLSPAGGLFCMVRCL